jgi:hypothetical protein
VIYRGPTAIKSTGLHLDSINSNIFELICGKSQQNVPKVKVLRLFSGSLELHETVPNDYSRPKQDKKRQPISHDDRGVEKIAVRVGDVHLQCTNRGNPMQFRLSNQSKQLVVGTGRRRFERML